MRALAVLLALLPLVATAAAYPYQGPRYDTEQKAQWACNGGEVVWVDPPTGRWFQKGNGWYGETRDGGYACRRDVDPDDRPFAQPPAVAPEPEPNHDDD